MKHDIKAIAKLMNDLDRVLFRLDLANQSVESLILIKEGLTTQNEYQAQMIEWISNQLELKIVA